MALFPQVINQRRKCLLNKKMNRRGPLVLYCHGLGATPTSGIAFKAKQFIEGRGFPFKSVRYRNIGNLKRIWNVDDWLEDIVTAIDRAERDDSRKVILLGSSAGCHSVLRATLQRPFCISGLFLLSPGVGLDLRSYVDRVLPHAADDLSEGKAVVHPAGKDGISELIDAASLQHFAQTCISNRMSRIPIRCPVRILHGSADKVVPVENVKEFVKKLESKDVLLDVLTDVGHYIPMTPRFEEMFDSLCSAILLNYKYPKGK